MVTTPPIMGLATPTPECSISMSERSSMISIFNAPILASAPAFHSAQKNICPAGAWSWQLLESLRPNFLLPEDDESLRPSEKWTFSFCRSHSGCALSSVSLACAAACNTSPRICANVSGCCCNAILVFSRPTPSISSPYL